MSEYQNTSSGDDEIISCLSHVPSYIENSIIGPSEKTKRAFANVACERASSIGVLDKMPPELLYETFSYLDLKSLARLSRVSARSQELVGSLGILRTLIQSARYIIDSLGEAGILGVHSIITLHEALCSPRCVSCGAYGPSLLLLPAERCCRPCQVVNQSLWYIHLPVAKACFGLTDEQMEKLPSLWTPDRNFLTHSGPMHLTTVKAAKELALKVHGSAAALDAKHPLDQIALSPYDRKTWKHYREAPLKPIQHDLANRHRPKDSPNNFNYVIGIINFPSLVEGRLEHGLWCLGCHDVYDKYFEEELDESVVSRLVPEGYGARTYFWYMSLHSRTKGEFIEHVKHCLSVAWLSSERRKRKR